MNNKGNIVVATSGGVDSAVAVLTLKQRGYNVIGCFLSMNPMLQNEVDARKVCESIGIDFIIKDISKEFNDTIINYFVDEYLNGRTPNPCVLCNPKIKFKSIVEVAEENGCEWIATGHYANKVFDEKTNRFSFKVNSVSNKDQTYMLWQLPQEYIRRTIFPIVNFKNKNEVREFAKLNNIPVFDKKDSQDVCFIENDYQTFLKQHFSKHNITIEEGDFIFNGKVIGKHNGIPYYTIGQRRGIGVSYKEPLYVKKIDNTNDTIELSTHENIFSNGLVANNINTLLYDRTIPEKEYYVKIRYKSQPQKAHCYIENQQLFVKFREPVGSITLGQSVVLYDDNTMVCGGVISEIL